MDVDGGKRVRASDPRYEVRRGGCSVVLEILERAACISKNEIVVTVVIDIGKYRLAMLTPTHIETIEGIQCSCPCYKCDTSAVPLF